MHILAHSSERLRERLWPMWLKQHTADKNSSRQPNGCPLNKGGATLALGITQTRSKA